MTFVRACAKGAAGEWGAKLGIVLLLVGGKARAKQGVDCLSLTLTLITLNL